MDIDDLINDNHRPEDQDPDPADQPQPAGWWNGDQEEPFSDAGPF